MKDLNNSFSFTARYTVILTNKYGRFQKGAFSCLEAAAKQASQEVRFDDTARAEVITYEGRELVATFESQARKNEDKVLNRLFGG